MNLTTILKLSTSPRSVRTILSIAMSTASLLSASARADQSDIDSWQSWAQANCDEVLQLRAHDGPLAHAVPTDIELQTPFHFDTAQGEGPLQVLAFRPVIDNKRVLYDFTLYVNDPASGQRYRLYDWFPATDQPLKLAPEAGIPVPRGAAALTLEMHYWNLDQPSTSDESGVELCLATRSHLRPHNAAVAVLDVSELKVPAGNMLAEVARSCTYRSKEPVTLFAAAPALHKLGTRLALSLEPSEGSERVLWQSNYRFGEREIYTFTPGVVIQPGDRIWTYCGYSNPTHKDIRQGWRGSDELCRWSLTYYPAGPFVCD